jgi:hypothetical protein
MSWFISSSVTSGNVGLCCFISRNIIQHGNPILEKDIGFFYVKIEMKTIRKKIVKQIKKIGCKHDFERIAFYYIKNIEVRKCTKCNKVIEIQH